MKRLAYAGLGFLATALAFVVVATRHASWSPLVTLAVAPDVSLLMGMSSLGFVLRTSEGFQRG